MPSKTIIYIYPDIIFAISSVMNLIILMGTNRLARLNVGTSRLILGAASGGLYSAAAAYPHLALLHSFGIKMVFGSIMFLITFIPISPRKLISGLFHFFLVSFGVGGIFFGVIFTVNSSPMGVQLQEVVSVINTYFYTGLAVSICLCAGLIKWGIPLFRKKGLHGVLRVPVKVSFADQEVEVEALLDTGNQLQDPISLTPVVVVEYKALCSCLPVELQDFFEKNEVDLPCLDRLMSDSFWATRFRVIPFTSLGKSNGMLVGFRPDQIEVRKGGQVLTKTDVIIGIYNKTLSPEGNYRALLHPDLLQEISA